MLSCSRTRYADDVGWQSGGCVLRHEAVVDVQSVDGIWPRHAADATIVDRFQLIDVYTKRQHVVELGVLAEARPLQTSTTIPSTQTRYPSRR